MYFPDYTAKVEAKREEANSLIAFDELASTFVILGDKQWIIGCSYLIFIRDKSGYNPSGNNNCRNLWHRLKLKSYKLMKW